MKTAHFTRLAAALAITAAIAGIGAIGTATAASATTVPWRSSDLNITVPVGVDGLSSAKIHAVRYAPHWTSAGRAGDGARRDLRPPLLRPADRSRSGVPGP